MELVEESYLPVQQRGRAFMFLSRPELRRLIAETDDAKVGSGAAGGVGGVGGGTPT